jgi:hypothetical protein
MADTKAKPYLKHDFVGKDGDSVNRRLERPLTWVGFECYLYDNKIICNLSSYEANADNSYKDYLPIITRIKRFIEKDQFEGATAGIFNANIIARKLGLADKQDIKLDVYDVKLNL